MKQNRAMIKKWPRRTDGRTAAAQASPVHWDWPKRDDCHIRTRDENKLLDPPFRSPGQPLTAAVFEIHLGKRMRVRT